MLGHRTVPVKARFLESVNVRMRQTVDDVMDERHPSSIVAKCGKDLEGVP